ncbi:unnamed protein product [Effrenium voratum]|nr:unnamed protein product [Effrenium voratum]
MGWQSKTLHLEWQEEVVAKTRNCCCTSNQRRPYAQLGSVELHDTCCGLCATRTGRNRGREKWGEGGIRPFFGTDRTYTEELCNELRARMEGRGDTAQRKQQTFLMEWVTKMTAQMPLILAKKGVQWPPSEATLSKLFTDKPPIKTFAELYAPEIDPTFDTQSWDVVCCCELLNCLSRTIELGPDEVVIRTVRGLDRATIIERRPYAQIDDVQKENACGCCVNMKAGELIKEPISNGAGCDDATITAMVVNELKRRIEVRGNIGQMKKLESIMKKVDDLRVLMVVLQDALGMETQYPPGATALAELYGKTPELPAIRPHAKPSEEFPVREFEVTNSCESLFCCCTQKDNMTLEPDKMVLKKTNCMGESVNSMPYAQLQSVDEGRCCYCCRGVNGIIPGCGCAGDKVADLAQELQQRKLGRGDVAQLKNQENTMLNAVELSVRTNTVMTPEERVRSWV